MKTGSNTIRPTLHGLVLVLAATVLSTYAVRAAIVGRYTPDQYTLHLWHLDETATPVADAATYFPLALNALANGATLGNPSAPGFGTALSTYDGGPDGVASTDINAVLSPRPLPDDGTALTYANPTTDAFTYEAIIRIDFDPTQNLGAVTNGGNGRNQPMVIINADGNTDAARLFQFRLDPKGINPNFVLWTNPLTQPMLEFININVDLGSVQSMLAPIPTNGPDAIALGNWYHVAVSYDGNAGIPGNLMLYWTRLDPMRTSASLIGTATMTNDLRIGALPGFAIGNSSRAIASIPTNSPTGNFVGLIDEVRMSSTNRSPTDMQFQATSIIGTDICDPGSLGSFGVTNGVYTVRGSGEDIVGSADEFYFAYLPLQGDGMIVARVVGMQPNNPQSEAGLMMRDGLDCGARHVFLGLDASTNMFLRRRLAANASSIQDAWPGTNVSWLRLTRIGNTFIGHVSTNGTNWNYAWATALVLPSQINVGLAVTAHRHGYISTAQFDNLIIGPPTPLPGPWPGTAPRMYVCLDAGTEASMQNLGGFPVLVGGVVGDQFSIKCTNNVAAPFASWPTNATLTNTWGVATYLDTQALTNRMRFYRAQRTGP